MKEVAWSHQLLGGEILDTWIASRRRHGIRDLYLREWTACPESQSESDINQNQQLEGLASETSSSPIKSVATSALHSVLAPLPSARS